MFCNHHGLAAFAQEEVSGPGSLDPVCCCLGNQRVKMKTGKGETSSSNSGHTIGIVITNKPDALRDIVSGCYRTFQGQSCFDNPESRMLEPMNCFKIRARNFAINKNIRSRIR